VNKKKQKNFLFWGMGSGDGSAFPLKWGAKDPQPVAQSNKSFLVRAGRPRFFSKKNRFT
jgi:hypothetical protein